MKGRLFALLTGCLLVTAGGFTAWRWWYRSPALPPGVSEHQYNEAADAFLRRYRREPDRIDTLSWLGESAVAKGQMETALACLEQIPLDHRRYGCMSRHQEGLALLSLKRAAEAEEKFKQFLNCAPSNATIRPAQVAEARDQLRYIMDVELRFEERRAYLRANIAAGYFDRLDLMKYCFPSLLRWNGPQAVQWLEGFHQQNPEDFRIRVALGRYRTGQGRVKEAQRILEDCLQERPGDLAARAALMECFREQGRWDRMTEIAEQLDPPKASDPWLLLRLRGHLHLRQREYRRAVDCFELVLESDPASADATQGLARAYGNLGKQAQQKQLLEKAAVLARIQNRTGHVQQTDDIELFLEVARLCEQIDLHRFALLWSWWATQVNPNHRRAQQFFSQLRARHPTVPLLTWRPR